MIAKPFEDFLRQHLDHYLIPAENLAIVLSSNNFDHVQLLLVNGGYSRIPVLTKNKKYLGTISLSDILSYKDKKFLTDWELSQVAIEDMVNIKIATISEEASLTEIMHLLVDYPFLPVVATDGVFKGIITRKSILKAVNSLLHNFTDYYDINSKND